MQHLLLEVANLKERHFLCLHFRTFQNVNACSVSRKMHHLIFSCGWDNIYWKSSCLVARMGQIYPTKIPLRDRDGNRNEVITETLFLSPYEDFSPSSFLFLFLFLYSYFLRIRTDIPYSSLPWSGDFTIEMEGGGRSQTSNFSVFLQNSYNDSDILSVWFCASGLKL